MAKVNENGKLIKKWLDEHEWHYREREHEDGDVIIKTSVTSESAVYNGFDITIICRDHDVQSLFFPPVNVPENLRAKVVEYLMRVNYRFRLGKFTMDYRDGEIRWETVKSKADLKADLEGAMDDLIGFACFVMDRFAAGIAAVLMGLKTPEQAFVDCDNAGKKPADLPSPAESAAPTEPPPAPSEGVVQTSAKKSSKRGGKRTKSMEKKMGESGTETPSDALATNYSLEGLNVQGKIPLAKVIDAVRKFQTATRADVDAPRLNILISGAPGSGKTAFAKYLGEVVGAELRTVRASELLSKYVGETERKLAEVFAEAKESGEILFIDEIDSFLQDRIGADHGWEVTQVNELLQQMEAFEGVMIGATNFADRLDKAVLRRFTYKLKLDYLTDEGKGIFFEKYFKTSLTGVEKTRLNAIENLTPGDFRTVCEELFYLSDRQTNAERLDALEAESEAKGRTCGKIGF